ncbi:MAG: hypothetical protein ABI402_18925 [Ferruginibacter sp.]
MKTISKIFKTLGVIIILFISACNKTPDCEESPNVGNSALSVIFKDLATGNYLYAESNPLYIKDSIKIFESNGTSLLLLSSLDLIPGTFSKYWIINFGPLYNEPADASSYNSEICKSFIVKYYHNQMDTIVTCFKAKKTECGSVFETLKVYNKGQQILNLSNGTSSTITIIKN